MSLSVKKLATTIGTGATLALIGGQAALAQGSTTINNLGEVKSVPIYTGANGLFGAIGNVVNIVLIVVGILAVLYLIYGGVMYLTAGGDAEKAGKGRTAITNAIIGIVIIILALAIYNFVISGVQTGTPS